MPLEPQLTQPVLVLWDKPGILELYLMFAKRDNWLIFYVRLKRKYVIEINILNFACLNMLNSYCSYQNSWLFINASLSP